MPVLHHIALGARDVEEVARFYREVLGLPEDRRHVTDDGQLRSIWLDLGGPRLMIERTDDAPRLVTGVGAGPFLVAVTGTPDERTRFEEAVASRGGHVDARTTYTSYARDPEGNRVAVSSFDYGDG